MSSFTSLHDVLDKVDWNLEDIKTFLELDSSSVNKANSWDYTPLIRVLVEKKYSFDAVKLLLSYGADVNSNYRQRRTPLIIALMSYQKVDVINLLLEKGAKIDFLPYDYNLICLSYRYYTSKDVSRMLLDAGCRLTECRSHGTALHCAFQYLNTSRIEKNVQLLIERGADVNTVNPAGQSLLCSALGSGRRSSAIKLLLSAGAILNCTKHTNPLLCATIKSAQLNSEVVQLLLDQGARMNKDVLQCAVKQCFCDNKVIGLLLDHLQGVDAKDVEDESNNTLLHLAACSRGVDKTVVRLLVKRGVLINRVNKNGDTALHKKVKQGWPLSPVLKTLLKSGSQVNMENVHGKTPLHLVMMHLRDADSLQTWMIVYLKMLLAAGSRFGATGGSLLNGIINKYIPSSEIKDIVCLEPNIGVEHCKMLLKFYFLENPRCDFQYLIQGHREYEELSQFGAECVRELQKLNLKMVNEGRTLREFLNECSPFQVNAANFEVKVESVLFNWLLRLIAENVFPIFFEVIVARLGRPTMKLKLRELQVYTYLSDESRMGKKVVLNYDSVFKIGYLLTDDDLLRFIAAFNKSDDDSAEKDNKRNICEDERSDEHCDKRLRLQV